MALLLDGQAPSVACVILNWNNPEATLRCLEGLKLCSSATYTLRVIVVDNGSASFPVERVQAAYPGAEMVLLPVNVGFAAGCNAGADTPTARGSDFVFFLNNDTLVANDFLAPLVAVMASDSSLGLVSPVERLADTNQVSAFQVRVDLRRGSTSNTPVPVGFDLKTPRLVASDSAHGGMLLIRGSLFRELDGFDASYFAYFEDVDLALRARRLGFRSGFYLSSEVYLFGGDSTRQHDDKRRGNIVRLCLYRRNSILLVRRHASRTEGTRFFCLFLPWQVSCFLLKSVVRQQWKNTRRYLRWTALGLWQRERVSPPAKHLRELGLQ